jgi:hypothetical protein
MDADVGMRAPLHHRGDIAHPRQEIGAIIFRYRLDPEGQSVATGDVAEETEALRTERLGIRCRKVPLKPVARRPEDRDRRAKRSRDLAHTPGVVTHHLEILGGSQQLRLGLIEIDGLERTHHDAVGIAATPERLQVRVAERIPVGDPGWCHLDAGKALCAQQRDRPRLRLLRPSQIAHPEFHAG